MGASKQKRLPLFPGNLDTPAFREAWGRWEANCTQRRLSLTDEARRIQLARCSEMGLERALAAIEHSMDSRYRSVYEKKSSWHPSPTGNGRTVQPNIPSKAADYMAGLRETEAKAIAERAEMDKALGEMDDATVMRLAARARAENPRLAGYWTAADPRKTPGLRSIIVNLWNEERKAK